MTVRETARRAGVCMFVGALGLSGCAHSPAKSMARAWQDVPKIWSTVPATPPPRKAAEPNVAANTPAEVAETVAALPAERPDGQLRNSLRISRRPTTAALAQRRGSEMPQDPFLELDDVASDADAERQPSSETIADVGELRIVSARDRLRAALSDDSRPPEASKELAGEQERLRLRIESLMNRARVYLSEQQLVAAKRAAELAQNLAESSSLEFAPEEERPVDLLTTINGRMESEQAEQALAQAEEEEEEAEDSESKSEIAVAEDTAEKLAGPLTSPRKPRIPFDRSLPFDPYEARLAVAKDGDGEVPAFGTSVVVLETPSFEDEEGEEQVSPIGYTRDPNPEAEPESAAMAKQRMTRFRRTERVVEPEQTESHADDADPDGELELPLLVAEIDAASEAGEQVIAPPPPIGETGGPKLEPAGVDESPMDDVVSVEIPDDEDAKLAKESRPKPAALWPRWLPLSLASLLTTIVCGWLWRRRALAE